MPGCATIESVIPFRISPRPLHCNTFASSRAAKIPERGWSPPAAPTLAVKRQDSPTLSRLPTRCDRGPVALRFGCGSAALNLCVQSLHRFYYSAPIILTLSLAAATNDLASALQKGLFEEEANHNLEAAAAAYQAVSSQFDKDRKLAATAIFRLGEVFRKQGKTNEAVLQYERIVREFSDQETLATLSRQQVSALGRGVATATAAAAAESSAQLTAARAEVASLTAELEQLQSLSGEELRLTVPHNYPNPMLTDLMKQLAAAEQTRVGLQRDFSPEHPEVARVTAQVGWLENQIQAQVSGTVLALELKLRTAKAVLAQLEETLTAVSTRPGSIAAGQIYVWGQVHNQGAINFVAGEKLTVAKAILRAGGFGEFANKKKVRVVRQASGNSGKSEFEVNMIEVLEQGKLEHDIILQPDDWVIIPSRNINF